MSSVSDRLAPPATAAVVALAQSAFQTSRTQSAALDDRVSSVGSAPIPERIPIPKPGNQMAIHSLNMFLSNLPRQI
jgi:hypothetical protein